LPPVSTSLNPQDRPDRNSCHGVRLASQLWPAAVPYDSGIVIRPGDPSFPSVPPIPNSYWVERGRLLAGEYPGAATRADTVDRVRLLLAAGVNTFIDLTVDGEIGPYVQLLPGTTSPPVQYQRWPIKDHGLPHSPRFMAQILDSIAAALAEGRCVYVHCRAGIGRTGTVIGCYLIRNGLTPEEALSQLQRLWLQCARSRSWPTVPETHEQREFVMRWQALNGESSLAQRSEGALLGLAIGDAFGELHALGTADLMQLMRGPLPQGLTLTLGANTAMTVQVAESLLARAGHDSEDQMQRYLQWLRNHPNATASAAFKRALASWQWSRRTAAGTHDPTNLDPHSLARTLAAVLRLRTQPAAAIELAVDVSRTTQQSPIVLDVCRLWAALLLDALSGATKASLIGLRDGAALQMVRGRKLRKELDGLLAHRWSQLSGEDFGALSAVAHALMALENTGNFAAGMREALAGTAMPATTAALYGTIAGAHYSSSAVPGEWARALPQQQSLLVLASKFAG
jgi:ADP-ribosylglycohydrolase